MYGFFAKIYLRMRKNQSDEKIVSFRSFILLRGQNKMYFAQIAKIFLAQESLFLHTSNGHTAWIYEGSQMVTLLGLYRAVFQPCFTFCKKCVCYSKLHFLNLSLQNH